jgi:hypothetical protein
MEAQLDEALRRLPTDEWVANGCFKSDTVEPSQTEGRGKPTEHSHTSLPSQEEDCAKVGSTAPGSEEGQHRAMEHLDGSTVKSVHDLTAKMTAFYAILNPSKLCDVAKLAVKFKDNADTLNGDLRQRYNGLDLSSSETEIWRYAQALRSAEQKIPTTKPELDYVAMRKSNGGLQLAVPVWT